jgi:peptide/nickel transport system permease protein
MIASIKRNALNALRLMTNGTQSKIGFTIVSIFVSVAVVEGIAGWSILPYNPLKTFTAPPFSPPSLLHPFGTEQLGRDLFSRMIAGTPVDAYVSFFVVAVALLLGGFLGSVAGYSGGLVDEVIMRITDVFFTIPTLLIAIVIVFILGSGPVNIMIALAIIWWPPYARLSRAEALRLKNMNFVKSAKLSNLSSRKIISRHIFKVSLTTMIVYATLDIGTVILTYSGLSYLGLSVRFPYPDWGVMVSQSEQYIFFDPSLALIPAIVILIVALGFILLGDGIKANIQQRRGML